MCLPFKKKKSYYFTVIVYSNAYRHRLGHTVVLRLRLVADALVDLREVDKVKKVGEAVRARRELEVDLQLLSNLRLAIARAMVAELEELRVPRPVFWQRDLFD